MRRPLFFYHCRNTAEAYDILRPHLNLYFMKKILLFSLALVSFVLTYSQTNKLDTSEYRTGRGGKPWFAAFRNDRSPNQRLRQPGTFLAAFLKASDNDELRLISSSTDELGMNHQLYQHYHKGIKVEGSTYFLHGKNSNIEYVNGEYDDIDLPVLSPRISEGQALREALRYIPAKKYRWQDSSYERLIKQQTKNPRATNYPDGELVICKPTLDTTRAWALAWKFTIGAIDPLAVEYVFVDAGTAKVVRVESLICTGNANGTADTRYSGTQNIVTDSYNGSYRLHEARNGVQIETLNLQKGTSYNSTVDFTDNDNNWTAAEHNNANYDNAATDVHWGSEIVLDYWRNVRGRNSIDNNGIPVLNYVHYGVNFDNAGWDRTYHVMSYGDGGIVFKPVTALDVCAHELGHGVCQFTSNLTYQGESGALNEGFSDIWGAVIENYGAPGKQHWLIGEDIMLSPFVTALRSMSNPKDPAVNSPCPDTYGGGLWIAPTSSTDFGGVHTNSGVMNHWFYLLSDGGNGTNDLGHAFCVSGIGITDAASIAYRTETTLTASATFASARSVSIQAATTLFGANSQQVRSVTDAWYAVGVGAAAETFGRCTDTQIDCNTVSFTAPFVAPSYSWSFSGDYTVNGSSTATTSGNYIVATGTYGNVYVTGNEPGCGTLLQANAMHNTFQSQIYWDCPLPVIGRGQFFAAHVDPVFLANNYLWYVNGNLVGQTPDNYWHNTSGMDFCSDGTDGNTLSCFVQTPCGDYEVGEDRFDWTCQFSIARAVDSASRLASKLSPADSLAAFQVYPNPASDHVTVTLPAGKQPSTIRLMTLSGVVMQELRSGAGSLQITTSSLPSGIYILQINCDGALIVKKIFVQR